MKYFSLLVVLLFTTMLNTELYASFKATDISIEMLLMRKGSSVKIILLSTGQNIPKTLEIERKSTAPLSKYRKVINLTEEQLEILSTEKRLLLEDKYPESRQLESYYRVIIHTADDVLKKPPAVFLPKASNKQSVTFGVQDKKDPILFEDEKDKVFTYEQFNLSFEVKREDHKVSISIAGGQELNGEWFIQRKSSKPLANFRRVKTLNSEVVAKIKNEGDILVDKYPESAQLDALYRIMVISKEGVEIILPSILLYGTTAGR